MIVAPGSSNGRTTAFGAVYLGSNPSPGTKDFRNQSSEVRYQIKNLRSTQLFAF